MDIQQNHPHFTTALKKGSGTHKISKAVPQTNVLPKPCSQTSGMKWVVSAHKQPKLCGAGLQKYKKKTKPKMKNFPNLTFKIFYYSFVILKDFFQDRIIKYFKLLTKLL